MPRKKTHTEFVEEMALKHPSLVVLGKYKNANTKITIHCSSCGHEWNVEPASLVNTGTGCPKCAVRKNAERQTLSHDEFMRRFKEKGKDSIEILGRYEKGDKGIAARCLVCGYEWLPKPEKLLQGRGCTNCLGRKRTPDSFRTELSTKNPDVQVLGNYEKSTTPLLVRCCNCGFEFEARPIDLLRGRKCSKCYGHYTMSHEEFVEKMTSVNPDIEILGTYKRQKDKILARCKKCGFEWTPTAQNLLKGNDCLRCSIEKRAIDRTRTQKEFEEILQGINADVEVLGNYITSGKKILVRCKKCGNTWEPTPSMLIHSKSKCPVCIARGTSYFEQYILAGLRKALGDEAVLSRDRKAIGKELDIYLPDFMFAIEPGSWFWHKKKLASDAKKRDLCKKRGIRLLIIYDSFTEEKPPFEDDCWVFEKPFSERGDSDLAREVLEDIFALLELNPPFKKQDWENIDSAARANSRMIDTDEIKNRLAIISPNIEVIGTAIGTKARIQVRCKKCGHEWKPVVGSLLQGNGCWKCGRKLSGKKQTMPAEDFISELAKTKPSIQVLGSYQKGSEPIRVKCLVCGHEWEPVAWKILHNKAGCPKCPPAKRVSSNRTKPDEFKKRFEEVGSNQIELIGEYETLSTPIHVKCKKCTYEWDVNPRVLLKGSDCPKCGRYRKRNTDDFLKEVAEINPNLKVIGTYQNTKRPILVECKMCGHRWSPKAMSSFVAQDVRNVLKRKGVV